MLIVLVITTLLLLAQTGYLLYYKSQIKDIGDQLAFISKHHSFKFIQTQLKPGEINTLINQCNILLNNQRELDQQFISRNEEINSTIISLSHDIRTPLTSLDGYLQLAERSTDDQEKTHYIGLAQSRIRQIVTLVDQLFLYTKLQNPEYVFELAAVDVMDELKRSLFTFIDEITRTGYEPGLELPETSILVIGNGNALERVFDNLLRNYFLHGEGKLSIRCEDDPDSLFIHFANQTKDKCDPSRTAHSSAHSSGLGLSIVKSLMEKMNGTAAARLTESGFCISLQFMKMKGENEHAR